MTNTEKVLDGILDYYIKSSDLNENRKKMVEAVDKGEDSEVALLILQEITIGKSLPTIEDFKQWKTLLNNN